MASTPQWLIAKKKIDQLQRIAREEGVPRTIPVPLILNIFKSYNTNVHATGEGATVKGVVVNIMADEKDKKAHEAEAQPSVDIDVHNQSTLDDVNVQRGKGRIQVGDRSAVSGVVVGGKPPKRASHVFLKITLPALFAGIGGSALYFNCRTSGGTELSGGMSPATSSSSRNDAGD